MICLFTDMCIYVCAFVLMSLSAYARVYLCVCVHIYAICIMTGIQLMPKLIKIFSSLVPSLPH